MNFHIFICFGGGKSKDFFYIFPELLLLLPNYV